MRHQAKGRKFNRERKGRTALLRSLASNLISKEKISTTEAKAKEIRPYVEKLVTKAMKDTPTNRRLISEKLGSTVRTNKLFKEIAPRFVGRAGGYTRITKLPARLSDASPMAIIEFVS